MKKILFLAFTALCCSQLRASPDLTWSTPPVTLSTVTVDASDPHIAVDSNGNTTAAWVESNVVKASYYPVGGSWGAAVTLSGTGASSPKLGVDSSGNVTALWVENGVINSSTLPFGGSWSAETALSGTGASEPQLAVDATGNAVGIWTRNGYIESATQLFGGSWSLVHMLSNSNSDVPHVAIGANGTVVAVWHSSYAGFDGVYSATSLISGSWNTAISILTVRPAVSHNYPRVAVDNNGNAVAVWFLYVLSGGQYADVQTLTASMPVSSTSWTAIPTFLSSSSGLGNPSTFSLSVGFDGSGNAFAMWGASSDGCTYNILTASLPQGGSWTQGGAIVLQDLYAFQSSASVSSIGDTLVVYMYYDGANLVIQATETDTRQRGEVLFTVPVNLSLGSQNGYPCAMAALGGSTVYGGALWISNNGTNNVIQAVTASGPTIAPPTGLAVFQSTNNFGIFTEYYNTVSWTASTDPTVIGYNIYRDGAYVTQVAAPATSYIDDNQGDGVALTYGVAAVTLYNDISAIISVVLP